MRKVGKVTVTKLHFPFGTLRGAQSGKRLKKLPAGKNKIENPKSGIPNNYKICCFNSELVRRYDTDQKLIQMVGPCYHIFHNLSSVQERLVLSISVGTFPTVYTPG